MIKSIYSWPCLISLAFLAWLTGDGLPIALESAGHPLAALIFLEGILFFLLYLAWEEDSTVKSLPLRYLFIALFLFRFLYRLYTPGDVMWAFQGSGVRSLSLSFCWYAIGVALLHPSAFRLFQTPVKSVFFSRPAKMTTAFLGAILLGWLFWTFKSAYITRDGFDWIKRATEPVWHLYLREPLTIGLHRIIFIFGWKYFEMTSYTGIALLSVISGVWSIFWLAFLIRDSIETSLSRRIAWLLPLSSGGFCILLFGHIEVYPVFMAGLLPTFFFAQRYLKEQSAIWPVSLCFSITFVLHLSTGWLIPAFLSLPFILNKNWKQDLSAFWGIFVILQAAFWSFLLFGSYDGSIVKLLSRLHDDFNVGPDKAMFIPWYAVWDFRHILDMLNDYLYISASGLLLLPFSIHLFYKHFSRQYLFWGLLLSGFFFYSIFWNPDRMFPEDWDLFSLLGLLLSLFNMQILLSSDRDCKPIIYIAAIGILPFVLIQIWFHHVISFVPAGLI